MICEKTLKKYCKTPELIENYELAITDKEHTWDCHHRAEILPCGKFSKNDLKKFNLYWNRPPEELIFLTQDEHLRLHMIGNKNMLGKHLSIEAKKKISEANLGKTLSEETKKKLSEAKRGENNPMFGKYLSIETKKKISEKLSEAHKRENNPCFGFHQWNNGIECKYSKECPGEGWKRGRIIK